MVSFLPALIAFCGMSQNATGKGRGETKVAKN